MSWQRLRVIMLQLIKANTTVGVAGLAICPTCIGQRKFSNNDQGNLVGVSIATIADADKIYMGITCTDGTDDITNQYGNVSLHRL